jgi:hypothetical protein
VDEREHQDGKGSRDDDPEKRTDCHTGAPSAARYVRGRCVHGDRKHVVTGTHATDDSNAGASGRNGR